ncbi:MAG: AI-2E family transporter [Gammaproteobacteria bacterium]|nr:AI-2E family transporter [Gammaproteobacteria bacterium]
MIAADRLTNLLIVFAAGWLLFLLSPILTPFVAAFLIAYAGDPLVDAFQKLRLSRTLSVVLFFVLLFFIVAAVVILIAPLVSAQAGALFERLPGYLQWVENQILPKIIEWTGVEFDGGKLGIAPLIAEYGSSAANWVGEGVARATRSGAALVGLLVNLFLLPVLTFYLLRDWDRMVAAINKLLPTKSKDKVVAVAAEADKALGGFLRGQVMVMIALAIIYSVGLKIVGIEYSLAIGVVSGIVSFVPYLGLVVGLLLAGLAAVAQAQSLAALIGVVVVFVVAQMIEGMLLTPRLVGDRIGLHPVLVIFAVMAGGQLFGFFGVLLALPAAAVSTVIVRFAYQHYFFHRHYEDGGDLQAAGTEPEKESQVAANEAGDDTQGSHDKA